MESKTRKYSVVAKYHPEDDCFVAVSQEFPGTTACGQTREEAVLEFATALELAIMDYEEDGFALPDPMVFPLPDEALRPTEIRVVLPENLNLSLIDYANNEGISVETALVELLAKGVVRSTVTRSGVNAAATKQPVAARSRD